MTTWENLSGENNWEGLLEPLDDDLRRYIIHYGEMAEATYKAYDTEKNICKYGEGNLFSEVGLGKSRANKNYVITKFITATARSFRSFKKETHWIGYVAVATDEGKMEVGRRDIVVAWRGSKELSEWENNMKFLMIYPTKIFGDRGSLLRKFKSSSSLHEYSKLKVHMGFYKMYTTGNYELTSPSASEQVREEVLKLLKKYENDTISVTMTGHSLGGVFAILSAIDIEINVFKDWNNNNNSNLQRPPVTAFTFGCPQFGNTDFVEFLNSEYLHVLRVENKPDIVPRVLPWVGDILDYIYNIPEHSLTSPFTSFLRNNTPQAITTLVNIIIPSKNWVCRTVHKITHHYYKDVGLKLVIDTRNSYHLKQDKRHIEAIEMAHNLEVYLHGISGTQGPTKPFSEMVERDIALINKDGDFLKEEYEIPSFWWGQPTMVQKEDGSWEKTSFI